MRIYCLVCSHKSVLLDNGKVPYIDAEDDFPPEVIGYSMFDVLVGYNVANWNIIRKANIVNTEDSSEVLYVTEIPEEIPLLANYNWVEVNPELLKDRLIGIALRNEGFE